MARRGQVRSLRAPVATVVIVAIAAVVVAGCGGGGDAGARGGDGAGAPSTASRSASRGTLPGGLGQPLTSNILGGPCAAVPARGAPLPWLPADLPLPPGTYPVGEVEAPPGVRAPGFDRAVLVVPVDIAAFARFALQEWPARGWLLGRGESEPGEVESGFYRGDAVGAYRARSVYCDRRTSELLVVYGRRQAATTTAPSPRGGTDR